MSTVSLVIDLFHPVIDALPGGKDLVLLLCLSSQLNACHTEVMPSEWLLNYVTELDQGRHCGRYLDFIPELEGDP